MTALTLNKINKDWPFFWYINKNILLKTVHTIQRTLNTLLWKGTKKGTKIHGEQNSISICCTSLSAGRQDFHPPCRRNLVPGNRWTSAHHHFRNTCVATAPGRELLRIDGRPKHWWWRCDVADTDDRKRVIWFNLPANSGQARDRFEAF